MATKVTDIQARIGASVGGFEAGMKTAAASASVFEKELAKLELSQRSMAAFEASAYREELARNEKRIASQAKVGKAFMVSGAAIALGIGLAVKAAVDWQPAFAGLEKVLPSNTSASVFGALDTQLRALSKSIPTSATDIAALATSAAQLGVPTKYLASFTKTATALGATTTLSADEAVTGLAKLGNVMQPGQFAQNIQRAGSALLALGNQGASTEAEILDMAQRIAGAGVTVGMTEPQVLGFANALTSVGLNAEAGGTAISRVMIDMAQAVSAGGKALDGFAGVAGMTSAQFSTAFKSNAAGAVTSFITGLGKIKSSGGDVFATLDNLKLSEVRVRDTLLRASGASELLTQSLATGEQAWKDSTALTDAASKRYETAASRIAIARNSLNDTAITIGGAFLPAVASAGDEVSGLISVFQGLPGPAKQALGVLGGIASAGLILGGAALTLVPKLKAMMTTLEEMGPAGVKAAGAIRSMGSALAGPLGIALAVGTIALGTWIQKQAEAKARVQELTQAVQDDGNAIGANSEKMVAQQLVQDGVAESARRLGLSQSDVLQAALGNAAAQQAVTTALQAQGKAYDVATGKTAIRGSTQQIQDIKAVIDAVDTQSSAMSAAVQQSADLSAALGDTGASGDVAATGLSVAADGATKVAGQTKIATSALTDFEKAIKAIYDTEFGVEAANDAFTKSLQATADAAKGKTTGGGKGKVTAADRKAASDAAAAAKAQALAEGETTKQATAAAKAAKARVLDAAAAQSTGAKTTAASQLELRAALRDNVQNALDVIDAMSKQGSTTDELTAKAKTLSKTIYDEAIKIGMTKTEAHHYADALLEVPTVVSTAVNTPGLTVAITALDALLTRMALVNGKVVSVQVEASAANVREDRTAALPAAKTSGMTAKQKRFASGGVEMHSAQIGYRRIWGEPETGGEAYIPLAPGKRAASTAVLGDVARRFGLSVSSGHAGSQVHIVRVPVQQSHHESHPINVTVGQVVTKDAGTFTDWASTQGSFGSGGQR